MSERPSPRRPRPAAAVTKPAMSVLPYETPKLREILLDQEEARARPIRKGIPLHGEILGGAVFLQVDSEKEASMQGGLRGHVAGDSDNSPFVGAPERGEDQRDLRNSMFMHLFMELCTSGELFARIVAKVHYSERQATILMKTLVDVVEACHSLGVMHRGLKPENFLFKNGDN